VRFKRSTASAVVDCSKLADVARLGRRCVAVAEAADSTEQVVG